MVPLLLSLDAFITDLLLSTFDTLSSSIILSCLLLHRPPLCICTVLPTGRPRSGSFTQDYRTKRRRFERTHRGGSRWWWRSSETSSHKTRKEREGFFFSFFFSPFSSSFSSQKQSKEMRRSLERFDRQFLSLNSALGAFKIRKRKHYYVVVVVVANEPIWQLLSLSFNWLLRIYIERGGGSRELYLLHLPYTTFCIHIPWGRKW